MEDNSLITTIDNPVLGQLELVTPIKKVGVIYKSIIVRGDAKFKLELYLSGKPLQQVIELAEMLILNLDKLTLRGHNLIIDSEKGILIPYNISWRPKSDPILSENDFLDHLAGIKKLTIYATGLCILTFATSKKLFSRKSVQTIFHEITSDPESILLTDAYSSF